MPFLLPPHCSLILPTRHGTDETPLGSSSPPPPLMSSAPSALILLGGSPTHYPTPRWELNPNVHVGGTLQAWVGLLPRPQCSLGQVPSLLCGRCSVAGRAGPGWWGVSGGLICEAGQALLGPRIPHQKLLQAPGRQSVVGLALTCHTRAPQGPPVPRPRVLVTGLWCRLRGAHGLRDGRAQGSQKLLPDVGSARPLPADKADLGVGRLLGTLAGTLAIRQ